MRDIVDFLYQLNNLGFSLWVENDTLKYRQYKEILNKEDILNKIKANKSQLIHCLNQNGCHKPEEINPHRIYCSDNQEATLSFAQERLWFVEKYEEGSNAYHIPMVFRVLTDNITALENSMHHLIERHEVLRTLIKVDEQGNAYQKIMNVSEFPLTIDKVTVQDQNQLDQTLSKMINQPYDLSQEYPIRISVFELNNAGIKEYYLCVVIHHIAFDGWSIDVFTRELAICFEYYSKTVLQIEKPELPNLSVHYKDFSKWQKHYLNGKSSEDQLNYWKTELLNYEVLNLPLDFNRPLQFNYKGNEIFFLIDHQDSMALRELSKQLKVSLYSILLSAYSLMLSCYSNQDDIIIGVPVSNRHYSGVENIIGFFINSLALRLKIDRKSSLKAFIQSVGSKVVQAQLYQDIPFEKIVEELKVAKDTSRHPVFQVQFSLQNFGKEIYSSLKNKPTAKVTEILQKYTTETKLYSFARFDIMTFMDDSGDCIGGNFNYAASLFSESTIYRFIETYIIILKEFVKFSGNVQNLEETKIFNLNYLNGTQYNALIYDLNKTEGFYPNKTIHELFVEQVERTPNKVAVMYEDQQLTFQELNEKSDRLAQYLLSKGAGPEFLIGIGIHRQFELIIGLFAILKSGSAYVPLDPDYPKERLKNIIETSKIQLLLVTSLSHEVFEEYKNITIAIDQNCDFTKKDLNHTDIKKVSSGISDLLSPDNLAYVIYTSGSTGKPKGVACSHRGVINRLQWAWDQYPFASNEVCCLQSSICFVDSTWDIFGTLLQGFPVVLYKPALGRDVNLFLEQCVKSNITRITLLPSFLQELIKLAEVDPKVLSQFKQIKHLEVTGEYFNPDIFLNFRKTFGGEGAFLDCYGATEATSIIYKDFNQGPHGQTKIISNIKIYILSNSLLPVPLGSIGEIYIGGVGLARGYFNQPDLTALKFIPNPFSKESEVKSGQELRLYKTGDLGRLSPNGNLEYLGRNDFLVKIRGYRIELGEIETVLLNYEGVKQSLVLAKDRKNLKDTETNNRYLVAYYTSECKLNEVGMLHYLQEKLPEYMVPTAVVYLKEMPLNSNGKIDRKALPDPELTHIESYIAPRNEREFKITSIWAGILGLDPQKIGIHDDFFRLGGNSILTIKLASQINKALQTNVSVASLFKYNTIAKLTSYLEQNVEEIKDEVEISRALITKNEDRLLSFAQERLWFIEKYEEGTSAYNMPNVFKLSDKTNIDVLEKSIQSIIERHEVLHSLIQEDSEGRGYQFILDTAESPLKIFKKQVKNATLLDSEIEKFIHQKFNLRSECPIKLTLFSLNDPKTKIYQNYLAIVIHHIAFDGWSFVVFFRELQAYYDYYLNQADGHPALLQLPTLSIQYSDFASWQKKYVSGTRLEKQLAYWKKNLNGFETLKLPTDKPRPSQIDYRGKYEYFELEQEISIALRTLAKELKVTLYSLLLSGYYLMLRAFSHQDDIVIGTPIANRHYPQVENLIGFFVNALALRVEINSSNSIKSYVQSVGQAIIEAQLHQDLPFEKLVEELTLTQDTSRHPIFQVVFGVQGFGGEVYTQIKPQNSNQITDLLQPYVTGDTFYNVAKFDISTFIDDSELILKGSFNYAESLYLETTIRRMIDTYIEILKQFASLIQHPEMQESTKISDIQYLNKKDYQEVVYQWNKGCRKFPNQKTISALFEEQVERTPHQIAIVYKERSLTYQELNEQSNQLANYLKSYFNIKPDTLIALCLERGEELLIAILGVLKAGAAYVPIDPRYPNDRLLYILEDTKTSIILTCETLQQKLIDIREGLQEKPTVLAINNISVKIQLVSQSTHNPFNITQPNNAAYVIYTSGTTGKPKGVLQTHSNVMRLFTATDEWFNFNDKDVWTLFHSYVFDFSVWEMWGALFYGAALVIPSTEETRDPEAFYKLCQQQGVTVLNQTPTAFYSFINYAISTDITERLTQLRYVIFGGEALNLSQLRPWFEYYGFQKPKLINMFGITETTVHVTYKPIEPQDLGERSYIGGFIPDLKAYVLNEGLIPLPIGGIGELYVGGAGLARGYLNKPELTSLKFVPNPFLLQDQADEESRLYKTGDLVRWLSQNNLEYIGRNDFQVKIRGYRIELGEIETALSSHPLIKQSVVLTKERDTKSPGLNGSNEAKYLIAYYIREFNLKAEDVENFVDMWAATFQSQYSSLDLTLYKQNFIGWDSSYTGAPIEKNEMLEWVQATVDRISELKPKVILEIGCGSGLILFNIMDRCQHYFATDFSKHSIDHINAMVDKLDLHDKITTANCKADELPYQQITKKYDTVVMNSIIQYFPTLDYLEKVIMAAIENIQNSGKIFLGDIRDYRLLKCFHYSVQAFKNNKVTKSDIDFFSRRDKELLISPDYFIYLKTINENISSVEVMPKLGQANHEMNLYRYDAILYIDKNRTRAQNQEEIIVDDSNFTKVLNLEEYLAKTLNNKENKNEKRKVLYIKYPNRRIIKDYIECQSLYNNTLDINLDCKILFIDKIMELVHSKNHKIKFLLDLQDPLYFNMIIYSDMGNDKERYFNYLPKIQTVRSEFSNNPLFSSLQLSNQFSEELRDYLSHKLPEYMIPEYYIQLEKLPLTVNGKLDKNVLPEPDFINHDNFTPPRNEIESKMCQILAEVLGLKFDQVGIRDDFFKLGGNSILAIRLAAKINHQYQSHLKVADIFAHKNVESLLLRMLQTRDSYQTVVKLNNTLNKPNMFMIHPGIGGCEVYISLAHKLENLFTCYGIDSYNLYHVEKIENMQELAKYYLSHIEDVMKESNQNTYHLLGWSIGGQIALEIASILEQRGQSNIKVYLLDAVVYDENLHSEIDKDVNSAKAQFKQDALAAGFDPLYIEKSLINIDVETRLSKQKLPARLSKTKSILFKAMLGDAKYKTNEYHQVDRYFINKNDINLSPVHTAHHGNILEKEDILIKEIKNFNEVQVLSASKALESIVV